MSAGRVYAWLLRLYPEAFRARFADDMHQTFAADHARAAALGRLSLCSFWIATLAENAGCAAAEHFARRPKGRHMLSGLLHDCRDAMRSLRAAPIVTTAATLSLALGVGANTALFSILNGLVLRPLPVRDPAALVRLEEGSWTNPIWEQIRDRQHELFDGAFAISETRFNLSDHGATDFVTGAYASGGMFDVLGVQAARGRVFSAQDDVPGGGSSGPVAVVSDRFWQRRLEAAPDAVGRRLTLNAVPFTIVGVMPPGFFGPDVGTMLDVIVPLGDEAAIAGKDSLLPGRLTWWLEIMARLKAGQTLEQANAALRAAQPQVRQATLPARYRPSLDAYLHDPLTLVPAAQGFSALRTRYQQPLTIILVVVSAVLVIACANIASLLLARASARRTELVVRLALGASRGRLARQLLIESGVLAFAGAALGLVFARAGGALLVRQIGATPGTVYLDLALDGRVLGFTTAVAAITALIFGLAPAVSVQHVTANDVLKQTSRSVAGDRRATLRNALVVLQIALSLALVVAGGLFVRTFASLVGQPLGFDASKILSIDLDAQRSALPPSSRLAHFEQFRDAAAAIPGVEGAALSQIMPLSGMGWNTVIDPARTPTRDGDLKRLSWVNAVSPEFFATYGMPLVAGRTFTTSDTEQSPLVVIVNPAFARKFFAGGNPVGREFGAAIGAPEPTVYKIVGLVGDTAYRRLREGYMPIVYLPIAQARLAVRNSTTLSVRTQAAARAPVTAALQRVLSAVDANASMTIRPLDDRIRGALAQERLVAQLSAFFAALALGLAALGLYGVTSYAVQRRRFELGIRVALGADRAGIMRLVLARVTALVVAGLAAGLTLAWWCSRFVSATVLYGITARDTTTFAASALVLAAVGIAAGWLPARRAARVNPVDALRDA